MLTKDYQYVIAVAEARSFSKAAKNLFIAQSSLSQYIKNLEISLGVSLFDRNKLPLMPTENGRTYLKTAYEIQHLEQQLMRQFENLQTAPKSILRIGITNYWGAMLLPRILPLYQIAYPTIEVIVTEGRTADILLALQKAQLDLAFITPPNLMPIINYQQEVILKEEILLAAHEKFVAKERQNQPLKARQLAALPFITLHKGQKMRQLTETIFKELSIQPKIVMRTANITTAYKLASVGYACCFIPEHILELTAPVGPVHHYSLSPRRFWELHAFYREEVSEEVTYLLILAKQVLLSDH